MAASRGVGGGAVVSACLALAACQAFTSDFAEFGGERVRGVRDRARQQDTILELRLEAVLPAIMREHGIGCWLVVTRGMDGDPMVPFLTVADTRIEGLAALLFCDRDGAVERVAIGRGLAANQALFEVIDDPGDDRRLAAMLAERLRAAVPERIAVNRSTELGLADGLSDTAAAWLDTSMEELTDRFVSSAPLIESFLAAQLDVEASLFTESARLTVAILEEVLSDRVVVAAGTSVEELGWAVRERAAALDLEVAFPPRTLVYRPGESLDAERRMGLDILLQPGDLFFLSTGLRYLGYANRYGRWAYLLPSGESSAPAWVNDAIVQLAADVERAAADVRPGMRAVDLRSAIATTAGVARLGRLAGGRADLLASLWSLDGWSPDFRLPPGAGLGIQVRVGAGPGDGTQVALLAIETGIVEDGGVRLVVPPQRTAILID